MDNATFARKPRESYDAGMPAMTDMVFQLLLVFVLGVGGKVAMMQQFQFDRTPVDGHAQPARVSGKRIDLQVVLENTDADGVAQYKVILNSNPALGERMEWQASGDRELMEKLILGADEARSMLEDHPDYNVKKVFLAPGSTEYRTMMNAYTTLERMTSPDWLVSMFDE